MDNWRVFFYPLGFFAMAIFGIRFLVQWIQSERAHKSLVTPLFWKLSLLGNISLFIHSLIQVQYHISLLQACNAVISWRNLNLMQKKQSSVSFPMVVCLFVCAFFFTTLAFAVQDWFFSPHENWFRIPIAPWQSSQANSIPLYWHILGAFAYFLFSCRFYVQWWLTEKAHASILPLSFWWISLIGAMLSIIYFIRIGDSVNLLGMVLGVIPYVRNILLMQKNISSEQRL